MYERAVKKARFSLSIQSWPNLDFSIVYGRRNGVGTTQMMHRALLHANSTQSKCSILGTSCWFCATCADEVELACAASCADEGWNTESFTTAYSYNFERLNFVDWAYILKYKFNYMYFLLQWKCTLVSR